MLKGTDRNILKWPENGQFSELRKIPLRGVRGGGVRVHTVKISDQGTVYLAHNRPKTKILF